MNVIDIPVTVCIDVPLQLGESPVWDDEREVLWFVDIDAPALFSFNPASGEFVAFRHALAHRLCRPDP
ncbi:SMP-30/gluconolactonase/LRE family protein [Pseudomonas asplenii]|uniref:SMP-30/gluconolactonase/LRE family protein n=1 Tax=Pseudomonas asplenii TaxID=53407 RepID=UPI0012FE7B84|nr:SMP-30/gluconolactonase/LRE family protein [Pseudomonas fuscovaginae]